MHRALSESLAAFLPVVINLYWVLVIFAATVALVPMPFATSFRNAVLLSACRGKLMDSKPPSALGPLSDWIVPQAWFAHFYAVGAIWNAAISAMFITSSAEYTKSGLSIESYSATVVALILFQMHLLRRLVETTLVMRYPRGASMHCIGYLFGLSYYMVVPLTVIPSTSYDSIVSSLDHLTWGTLGVNVRPASLLGLSNRWTQPIVQFAGIAIFLAGNVLQYHSHALLANLTTTRGGKINKSSSAPPKYRIPRGGAFELVSCPHYFAEIVIYVGLALILTGVNTKPWLMAIWVVANLVLAAKPTHQWYKEQFKSYPKKRKALIPFLYLGF